ncbi:MAG: cation transporter [Chloroflexi bacterium]|nr:cation transporter [Chloroflexota bacterium]
MKKIDFLDSKTCTLLGLILNLILTFFKLFAGIFGLSYAMIADGIHSATDTLATATAYVGIRVGEKPADEDHPYGHAGAETVAAFVVALIILGTGIFLGGSAIRLIIREDFDAPGNIALIAAIVSIFVKEGMFRYTIKVGENNNSPAVIASAWDHRSDAYTSVAALIGIIGAKIAYIYLDPIAGLLISALIIWMAIKLLRSNIGIFMYERPDPDFLEKVKNTACAIDGVKDIHDIRVHRCGPGLNVDIKIAVNETLSVGEGHHVAGKVRSELLLKIEHVREVMIHVNPYQGNLDDDKS